MFRQEEERDQRQRMLIRRLTYCKRSWREQKDYLEVISGRIVFVLVMERVLFWRRNNIINFKT